MKNYFDHHLMNQDGFNVNEITIKEQNCFFIIGALELAGKYINFPKYSVKTNYYEIIFITNGHNIVSDNLYEIKQEKNQIRFCSPGKITAVKELSSDIKGFYILFDNDFVGNYFGVTNVLNTLQFFDLDAHPILDLTAQQASFFDVVFKKIKQDYTNDFENSKHLICQYLISILKECNHLYAKTNIENSKRTSAEHIAKQFIGLVNKFYLTKRSLKDYATLLNITTKHLSKCVKNGTGETPMNFIKKMLVLEAKVLLKETNLTVSEIAYQLSFDDAAYFNRFFKKHTNYTPAGFRNNK